MGWVGEWVSGVGSVGGVSGDGRSVVGGVGVSGGVGVRCACTRVQ